MNSGTRRYKRYPKHRDSRAQWLPEIPVHWDVARLKDVSTINESALPEDTDPSREIEYVDIGGVNGLGEIIESETMTFASAPSRARRLVHLGDVIVSTVRTYLRAIASIRESDSRLVVSTGFAVIHPKDRLLPEYAAYVLQAPLFVERVVSESKGVSFPAILETEMSTFEIPIPPPEEQRAIAAFIDRGTAKIDALVAKKERLIELLEEKRSAVNTRAVTKGLDADVPLKGSTVEWLGEVPSNWTLRRLKEVVLKIEQGWSPDCENRPAEIGRVGRVKSRLCQR